MQAASQTWKNFTVKTTSATEAANLVKEIDSCISQYGGYAEDPEEYYSEENINDNSGNGGNSVSSVKAKDWTTYIVIGAAAAIILLLLWNRKKK